MRKARRSKHFFSKKKVSQMENSSTNRRIQILQQHLIGSQRSNGNIVSGEGIEFQETFARDLIKFTAKTTINTLDQFSYYFIQCL